MGGRGGDDAGAAGPAAEPLQGGWGLCAILALLLAAHKVLPGLEGRAVLVTALGVGGNAERGPGGVGAGAVAVRVEDCKGKKAQLRVSPKHTNAPPVMRARWSKGIIRGSSPGWDDQGNATILQRRRLALTLSAL